MTLNPDQFENVRMYHGSPYPWKSTTPSASYEHPLHVDTNARDFPVERAFGDFHSASDPAEAWEAARSGQVHEFKFRPGARVHVTDTPHHDGILPDEEMQRVRSERHDATLFPRRGGGYLGTVYNPEAVEHVKAHGYEITGNRLEDEMEWNHGEDWRDYV